MSEPLDGHDSDQWEQMLRAVLGEEAADQIISQMRDQGIDPGSQLNEMMNPANFNAVVAQVKSMLGSAGDGPVNWKVGEQVAREMIQTKHPDSISSAAGDRARTALQTGSLWLDPATAIDPCLGPNQAWSRLDWLAHSLPTYKNLTEPVGANVARAFTQAMGSQLSEAPEEVTAMFGGDPAGIMQGIIASVLGMQFGTGLAQLAAISFGTSDSGLPLSEGQTSALVPSNIAEFAEGLEAEDDEVLLFAAVREQATARLYSRIPWLRPRILDTVAAYAADIQIDTESIEDQVRSMGFDPQNFQELDLTNVFSPEPTDTQKATLARLEHLLSLVEGWVCAISMQAVAAQLPHAVPLNEMFQRRSATDSPINQVFGNLVGLRIRPRAIREATKFWERAGEERGIEGRDGLWAHPDLLPSVEALENPDSFFASSSSDVEAELDAFLSELLAEDTGGTDSQSPHEPPFETQ